MSAILPIQRSSPSLDLVVQSQFTQSAPEFLQLLLRDPSPAFDDINLHSVPLREILQSSSEVSRTDPWLVGEAEAPVPQISIGATGSPLLEDRVAQRYGAGTDSK